jgi:hypothetical protein
LLKFTVGPFFHATREIYASGTVLDIVEQTRFYTCRMTDPDFARTEAFLERHRPAQAVSRRVARFACKSVADCATYLRGEHCKGEDRPIRYYRVSMPGSTRAPMLLVDHIYRHLDRGEEYIEKIVREYWNPAQPWKFWEVLGSVMSIEEEVEGPADMAASAGFCRAAADRRLRDRLWP